MLPEDNSLGLKRSALAILELQRNLYLETQTIEQILVSSKICVPEDIANMRDKVYKLSPKIKELNSMIAELEQDANEQNKFETLFQKSLEPGGREQLTQEERSYLIDKINRMTFI